MKLINELTDELIAISKEFNRDNDNELKNIKIDLLIQRLKAVKLNLNEAPFQDLDAYVKQTFNHYTFRRITKAVASLELLKTTDSKRKYNAVARKIIANKFYLLNIHQMIIKNKRAYVERNKMTHVKPFEIFIESEK